MRSQEFFNIISDIDERFVNEVRDDVRREDTLSETQRPQILRPDRSAPKAFLKPIMCSAACLAAVGGAALGFARFGGGIAPADTSTSDAVLSGAASSGWSMDKQYAVDGIYRGYDGVYNYFQTHYAKDCQAFNIDSICFLESLHLEDSLSSEDRILAATTEYADDCLVLDFDYAPGSDIYAIDGGVVVYAGISDLGVGNTLIIKHTDNDYSVYGYLGDLLVKDGDFVENGDVIAGSGSAKDYCAEANYDTSIMRLDKEISISEWQTYSLNKFNDIRNDILSADELQIYYNLYYAKYGRGCEIYDGSFYSGRDGYSKDYRRVDFKYDVDSDIFALDDGVVTYAGASDYGNLVIIRHADYYSGYCYLGDVLVNIGDTVKNGVIIARSGSALNYCDTLDYDVTVLIFYQELTFDNCNGYIDLIVHETP